MNLTKLVFLLLLLPQIVFGATFSGQIFDVSTNEAIPFVSVTVIDEDQSILGNEDGNFRIKLEPGSYIVKFSHVAYYSNEREIQVKDEEFSLVIYLNPAVIELPEITVYDRDYDAAQRIIIEAIKRKDELLSQLNKYNFEAYTKLLIRDTSKNELTNLLLITETQLKAFWEYPDKYKEIITARKQSANIDPTNNLVTVGEILNFNSNRIDIVDKSIVSPTANDALDYYDYYLLDTLYQDSSAVFLLELEPKSKTTPLFQGTIKIADSSYAVVGVDLTLNEAFDIPYIKDMNIKYNYQEFQDKYWMPTVINFNAVVDIPIPLIPTISLDYTAALHKYYFEPEDQDTVFNDYVLEVDEMADDFDSTTWDENQLIPLTALEEIGYAHIDSLENNKPLYKKLFPIIPAAFYLMGFAQDFFHFNKVEGPYLGGKYDLKLLDDRLNLNLKSGYAFDLDKWQHNYGINYQLDKKSRLTFGVEYKDMVMTQHTVISQPNGNASLKSLFEKTDPYKYHHEKGFSLKTSVNPTNKIKLGLNYNNYDHSSLSNNTDYSFFNRDSLYRENAPIKDGDIKSLSFELNYDSQDLMKLKGEEKKLFSYPLTKISVGVEKSDRSLLNSDFEFVRAYASLYTERQVLGVGIGKLSLFGGQTLSGHLPPQRYFAVDYASNVVMFDMTFKTFDKKNFTGNRVASMYYFHDFGTLLFRKSKLPLIEDIPLSLNLHGGVFWTDLHNNGYNIGDEKLYQTDHPYSELGFGIGRISFLRVYLTWQLSAYDTEKFFWGIDIGF